MNIEQTLRQRWASHEPLTTLVPLARLWTGDAPPSAELPFVVLDVMRITPHLTTSNGRLIEHATVRFTVFGGELDVAAQVGRAIEQRFERTSFALDEGTADEGTADEGVVHDMRRQQCEQRRGDDGVWTMTFDYLAITDHFPQGD
jgi:hypothetical protein